MKAETTILIDKASQHFQRLCTHFRTEHRLQVDMDASRAEIILPDGWCAIEIRTDGLYLVLKAWDHAAMEPMKAFFTRHLQRLVFQGRTPVNWAHPWIEGVAQGDIVAAKLQMLASALDPATPAAQGV